MQTQKDISNMKEFIKEAFSKLGSNDKDLIKLNDENNIIEYDCNAEKYERKLHKVCINHRLAYYFEELLVKFFNDSYCVDIEYNRYYKNKKSLKMNGEIQVVRPDIIIHTRALKPNYTQHLLVIEAKKERCSQDDINKVIGFIEDSHYNYSFGLTVCYKEFNPISGTLYYKGENDIMQNEYIEYPSK